MYYCNLLYFRIFSSFFFFFILFKGHPNYSVQMGGIYTENVTHNNHKKVKGDKKRLLASFGACIWPLVGSPPPPLPLGHWKWPAGRLLKNTQNTYVLSWQRDFDRKKSVAWRPPRQWDDRPMRSSHTERHTYIKKRNIVGMDFLQSREQKTQTDTGAVFLCCFLSFV